MWAKRTIGNGTSVFEVSFMYREDLDLGRWYRGKEKREGMNFASYMLNKKWTFEEEFNKHLLRFQQVTVSFIYRIKLHFDIPGWIDSHRSSFRRRRRS